MQAKVLLPTMPGSLPLLQKSQLREQIVVQRPRPGTQKGGMRGVVSRVAVAAVEHVSVCSKRPRRAN